MAHITLNYNARNLQAKNALNYILSTGLFIPDNIKKTGLEEAFEDIEKGRVYSLITSKRKENAKRETYS
jgi:hypothetical protein